VSVLLLTLIAWHSADSARAAVISVGVAVLFGSLVPLWYLLLGVRRGRWANHHVPIREQRRGPLLVGLASVIVGLVVRAALGAARELLVLIVAMIAGLVVSLVITHFWKMSIHTGVVAGTTTILVLVFGQIGLLAVPFVALVAWARVELGDHTPAQVLAGCAIGASVAGTVFPLLS
jgi:hypothetical protein